MIGALGRSAPWVTLVGSTWLLLGLLVDAALHRRNPGLAASEDLFSLANPGHALAGFGIALSVIGTLFFLVVQLAPGRRRSLAARFVLTLTIAGLLGLSGLSLAAAGASSAQAQQGHSLATGRAHAHGANASAPVSEADRLGADRLLADSRAGAARFADFGVAEAEGYVETTLVGLPRIPVGPAHFTNRAYILDGRVLDPTRPETLVYHRALNGKKTLLGVMYVAPVGQGPRVGGPLTAWHTHDNACFRLSDGAIGFVNRRGECPAGLIRPARQPEMLHVWLVDNPDGPFADRLSLTSVRAALRQP